MSIKEENGSFHLRFVTDFGFEFDFRLFSFSWDEPLPDPTWNASQIVKDFLWVGSGIDLKGRCLINRPLEPLTIQNERLFWYRVNNVCYALNAAGSPFQEELRGISVSFILFDYHI